MRPATTFVCIFFAIGAGALASALSEHTSEKNEADQLRLRAGIAPEADLNLARLKSSRDEACRRPSDDEHAPAAQASATAPCGS